jgi:hypothetical protein
MRPRRIRLSRRPGWRKPPGTVVVARPSRWGNPFRVGAGVAASWGLGPDMTVADLGHAVDLFRQHVAGDPAYRAAARMALAGRDLACWCPPGQPCHVDVLLSVANPYALSVRRPWAQLLISGAKPCENRSWSTRYRGPLVIHAGLGWDPLGHELASLLSVPEVPRRDSPTGYVGAGDLVDVHRADDCPGGCGPWGEPQGYHWVVAGACAFDQPHPRTWPPRAVPASAGSASRRLVRDSACRQVAGSACRRG